MTTTNLASLATEALVLHAAVARQLFGEFPEVHGIMFFPNQDPPTALPQEDFAEPRAAAYRDPAFEARAQELLAVFAPRMAAILSDAAPVTDLGGRFDASARRQKLDPDPRRMNDPKEAAIAVGGFVDGLGTISIRQEMMCSSELLLALSPVCVLLRGMVADAQALDAASKACGTGLRTAIAHMIANDMCLNRQGGDPALSGLLSWVNLLPDLEDETRVAVHGDLVEVTAKSTSMKINHLPIAKRTDAALDEFIRWYDPATGFVNPDAPATQPTATI